MYKLSPSDFAYLYEECKHCYYLKVRRGIERPKGVFPAIFGAINTRIQGIWSVITCRNFPGLFLQA